MSYKPSICLGKMGIIKILIFYILEHAFLFIAAAAAKSLQLCLTLCDPREYSLSGFSVYGIFQARVLEWGASAFSVIHSYKCNFRVYCWVKFYDFISSFYIFLFKVISWFCFVLFCSWNLTLSGDIMKLIVFYTYSYCI